MKKRKLSMCPEFKAAKKLFAELCSVSALRLGPYLLVDDATRYRLDNLKPSYFKIFSEVDFAGSIIRAPSPWHAALMMMAALEYTGILEGQPFEQGEETGIMSPKTSFIFRGQGDKTWDLTPKLERKHINRDFETRTLHAFCALILRLFESVDMPSPSAQAHIATAQHYGIATRLLDFTADPSVAVWFAANEPKRCGEQEAVVFMLSLSRALDQGAKIVLPPPFVERLYIQRGLFIEPPEGKGNSLRQMCTEIHFPVDSSFEVIKEEKTIDLCPQEPWLEKAVDWARKWATGGREFPTDADVARRTYYEAFNEIGYPQYVRRGHETIEQIALWVDFATEMFYWLGAIIVDRDKEWVNTTILDVITRDNRSLIELCTSLFEAEALRAKKCGEEKLSSSKAHYAKLMHDALSRTRPKE